MKKMLLTTFFLCCFAILLPAESNLVEGPIKLDDTSLSQVLGGKMTIECETCTCNTQTGVCDCEDCTITITPDPQ
jgi:hypothetical protein